MGTVTGAQFIKTNELENKSRPCTTMHCINDDCSCDVGLYVIPFGTPEFLKMTPGWKKNWNLVSDQRSLCCNWSCYAVSHPPETYSFLFLVLKNLIQLLSSHWFKIIYFYITFSKESFFRYFLFPWYFNSSLLLRISCPLSFSEYNYCISAWWSTLL